MFFKVYVLMLCTNVYVFLFLYWKLMFQDLTVISLYMPKTIVSVVKKTKLSLLFYLWCNWCITRKCVFDVYLFVCLLNISYLVQSLSSFQCLYQKDIYPKSSIINNFTVQAPIGCHLRYVTITFTAIQSTSIKYFNKTEFWHLLF